MRKMIKHTARNTLDTDHPRVGKFPLLIPICPVLLISVVFECEQVQTLKMYFLSSLLFLRSQLFWGVLSIWSMWTKILKKNLLKFVTTPVDPQRSV